MDVGFVILSLDKKIEDIKCTVNSIQNCCYQREAICIVPGETTAKELKEIKELCPAHKGGKTVTSLINTGMKKCPNEWTFLLFAGSRVSRFMEWKFEQAKQPEDILFPVVNWQCDFVSGSFNGVMIHQEFFDQVGEFPDCVLANDFMNDFQLSKLLWALDAINLGAKFKGIVGMKVS